MKNYKIIKNQIIVQKGSDKQKFKMHRTIKKILTSIN